MSTSATTKFKDNYGTVCAFATQCDGYPTGHGQDLKEFLQDFTIVNGLSVDKCNKKIANGVGCLAAQAIKHFKDGPGHTYMVHPDEDDEDNEDCWLYIVTAKVGKPINLKVKSGDKVLYNGTVKAYKPKD